MEFFSNQKTSGPGQAAGDSPAQESGFSRGSPRRLLFVEGDQAVPRRFTQLLQERSRCWDVAAAASAREAIALLERKSFDAVVASARLPGGSGVDLLNQLARRFPNLAEGHHHLVLGSLWQIV